MNPLHDRFSGCIIGGAAGDALGYPVEFRRRDEILRIYGASGVTSYSYFDGFDKALVSDDTQMTLFTANGLLRCAALKQNGESADETDCIRTAYLEWLYTQEHPAAPHPFTKQSAKAELPLNPADCHSWLMEIPWLYGRRAPGNTCLTALINGGNGSFSAPLNHSKGCGGVMRTAPAGLYAETADEAMRIGAEAAVLTHGHPLGYLPAGALSYIVHRAVRTGLPLAQIVAESLDAADAMFAEISLAAEYLHDFRAIMEWALEYAGNPQYSDGEAIKQLGEGWVGEEALAIAVYCAVRHENDFAQCLTASVSHDGDSDSTGAIAGNILGARLGLSAIPSSLTDTLEGTAEMQQLADDLYHLNSHDDAWRRRYLR